MRLIALLALYGGFAGAGAAYQAYTALARDVPNDLSAALDYHPRRATLVYSADGQLIGEFFEQKRVVVALDTIPLHARQAFIAAEDRRFWDHPGYDYIGIARAAWVNYQGGDTRQGASTITQQVARMLLLSRERSYVRKMKELILAVRIERRLSKEKILHLYLNQVYLGRGAYGVQAAAEIYFGKDVSQLTVAEAAMLAGLPKAPGKFAPHINWDAARRRQRYVLARMAADGYLTVSEAAAAEAEPIGLVPTDQSLNAMAAPYFVEHIRRWATLRYGHRSLQYGGLRIYTTLDMRQQLAAEVAVRDGIQALDRKIGFRGPLGHLPDQELRARLDGTPRTHLVGVTAGAISERTDLLPDLTYVGVVTKVATRHGTPEIEIDAGPLTLPLHRDDARTAARWRGEHGARLAAGDEIPVRLGTGHRGEPAFLLWQQPDVQAAFISLDPATGRVRAMVGGLDYAQSQFNRATQARRQPGSSFKPIIYAAALAQGYHHLSIVRDAPISIRTASGALWSPGNYRPTYLGQITLRTALAKSVNTVSVRLVLDIGIDAVHEMARRLGITSWQPRNYTIALGTGDVSLLELIAAYACFPAQGMRVTPRFVDYVTTDGGVILEDYRDRNSTEQAIAPELAYLVVELMKTVVARGTGRKAQALGRPAAGKTGTSTEHRDAWFLGYTTDHIAGVWVGRDDFGQQIGAKATGGSAALPIWLQYMRTAHPDTPVRDFPPPAGIVFVRANELTGAPASPGSAAGTLIPFAQGTVPEQFLRMVRKQNFSAPGGFAN